MSNFAAIFCAYDKRLEGQRARYFAVIIFMILYLSFAIVFGIRLNDWNDDVSGHCYSASRIALPNSKHPYVDQIYLGITAFYVFCLLLSAMIFCRIPQLRTEYQREVILGGLLQFILHVYMAISVRVSNQGLLNDASIEEQWGVRTDSCAHHGRINCC